MGFTIVLRSNKYNIFFEFYIRKSFNIATMTNSMEVAQVIKNKMAIIKILQTINSGEGVEKREFSCTVGGNVNWYSHYGRWYQFSSVQFSHSVVSDSLRPHESQHARPPCPSPTPGVHSHSRPSSLMPSSHLILCRPLLLLPPIPPSIKVFSNESTLRMRWPK